MIKISVIAPVLNEAPWIGYSIMAGLPSIHEFVYSLDSASNDGTRELLQHIKDKYAHEKLVILNIPNFHPSNQDAYNRAFNIAIEESTGDACFFLHPDMLITEYKPLKDGPLAWWTNVTSYAGDFSTVITKGRCTRWKNIHRKQLSLHYFGAYGSANEDFYHSQITGKSYRHFGEDFEKYPFEVKDSGISIDHYCELKPYKRRLEKMKLCLATQNPQASPEWIEERAANHPRVTLEQSSDRFGTFEFKQTDRPIPAVIAQYKQEFEQFTKKGELVHG